MASKGSPATWIWLWGDNRRETHTNPLATNTWAQAGAYKVRLIVKNAAGDSSYQTQTVTIPKAPTSVPPPVACVPKLDTTVVKVILPAFNWATRFYVDSVRQQVWIGDYRGNWARNPNGTFTAYRFVNQITTNPGSSPQIVMGLAWPQGTSYRTIGDAWAALVAPPPPGWTGR